jgi:hypothetical protein
MKKNTTWTLPFGHAVMAIVPLGTTPPCSYLWMPSTTHKKANKSNHWVSKNLQLLDTLSELYKGGHEGVDHMARALVLHGAKFDHYLNPNRYADAKLWVELFLGGRCIEESDWLSSKGWIEMSRK